MAIRFSDVVVLIGIGQFVLFHTFSVIDNRHDGDVTRFLNLIATILLAIFFELRSRRMKNDGKQATIASEGVRPKGVVPHI